MISLPSLLLQSLLLLLAFIFLNLLHTAYSILLRPQLSHVSRLPGPPRESFMWGCMGYIFRSKPGEWHEKMIDRYGKTFSYKGFMNTNRFCTVDTRALNHILTRIDVYEKPEQVRRGLGRVLGAGLLFAEGNDHRKQRKTMNPSFSLNHIRTLLPIFYDKAIHVRDNWLAALPPPPPPSSSQPQKGTINVLDHLSRMALDIIGLTGFDYAFDSLSATGEGIHNENELSAAFAVVLNHPGGFGWWQIIINWFPILYWIPTRRERDIEHAIQTLRRIGKQLIAEKKTRILEDMAAESGLHLSSKEKSALSTSSDASTLVSSDNVRGKDMLSLLIKANMSRDLPASERLSDEDVLSQISTFVIAGHETTSTSLSWTLLAIATHPEVQERLREECQSVGERPSLETLESMKYLDAVVKESLRWNSIVPSSIRTCMKDDVVPLSDGSTVKISKGDGIFMPIVSLNRLKDLWGPDAHLFNPDRWLTPNSPPPTVKSIPGVYSDLMTFIGGPRGCIGVKFAVVEMKAVLHTLFSTFWIEKAHPDDEIIQRTTIVTRPLVKGREDEGNMMPLGVEVRRG